MHKIEQTIGRFPEYGKKAKGALDAGDRGAVYDCLNELRGLLEETMKGMDPAADGRADKEIHILAVGMASDIDDLRSSLDEKIYRVSCVNVGGEALGFIQEHSPGLLILDADMPESDGFGAAKRIRDGGYNIPIIFAAENVSEKYVIEAIDIGAVDFIIKPMGGKQAFEMIAKHTADGG
jgi:CheY-like chemotaxis protein